jgi:hypothetical protein
MHSTHRRLSTIVHNLIHTRPAGTPQTFRVVNPVSGLAHSVQRSTAADADAAIEAAAAGLGEWRATPLVQRQAVLSRAADLLADVDPDNTDTGGGWGSRLVAVNRRETPVSSFWATAQIGMAAGALRALVDSSGAALAPQVLEEENGGFGEEGARWVRGADS